MTSPFCELCEHTAGGEHHILHRSLGGEDTAHNLVAVCEACHAHLHSEKVGGRGWTLTREANRLLVVDSETGDRIIEKHFSDTFDQGLYLNTLQRLPRLLYDRMDGIKYLDVAGLEMAAEIVQRETGKAGWLFMATLIQTAMGRIPYGLRNEKLKAIAQRCGLGERQVRHLLQAVETFGVERIAASPVDKSTFFVVAARQEDPEGALTIAEERIADNPTYPIRALEAELKSPAPLEHDYCICPTCGQRHLKP